jgi:hypothetical protein
MKAIKIIKGITFVIIGVIIFTVKFYDISQIVYIEEIENNVHFVNISSVGAYFDEFFKQTGINVILSLLFVGVGVMEIIESKGVK